MRNTWILARLELRRIFVSPLAWAIMSIMYFFAGFLFIMETRSLLKRIPSAEIAHSATEAVFAPLASNLALLGVFAVPLLTMRLFSDERRSQTITLLFSAPLSMGSIVLGKFLGVLLFMVAVYVLAMILPFSLFTQLPVDWGILFTGTVGTLGLFAVYTAVGLLASMLTAQPPVAGLLCLTILVAFWLVEWAGIVLATDVSQILLYFSFSEHFYPFLSGELRSDHLMYFLLLTVFLLFLSIRQLHLQRIKL